MDNDLSDETELLQRLNIKGNFSEFPDPESDLDSSESEGGDEYCKGGYYPVQIGETFNNGRYILLQKMGWGHFSTVWLAFDVLKTRHCAIKVHKSDPRYTEAAHHEIKLLQALKTETTKSGGTVVELLDYFEQNGPNGQHICLIFEVLSQSLLSLFKRFNYNGIPVAMIKVIAKQILEGLNHIHINCGIIHTDLKPENVLFVPCEAEMETLQQNAVRAAAELQQEKVKRNEGVESYGLSLGSIYRPNPELAFASGIVKLVDFGNACWVDKYFTDDIQTRQYRAPEVILGCGYNTKVDMWSMACMLFEMITGDFLFDPHSGNNYDRDEDHLGLMIELLGPIPSHVLEKGSYTHEFFDSNGELRHIRRLNFWSLRSVLLEKYKFAADEADMISSFLSPMLRYDSQERASAGEQLKHKFLIGVDGTRNVGEAEHKTASTLSTRNREPRVSDPGENFPLALVGGENTT